MSEKRQDFLARFDWIRTRPDVRAARPRRDVGLDPLPAHDRRTATSAILFIEVSGCLPMCGHGTIGTVTMALEHGLVTPNEPGAPHARTPSRPRRRRIRAHGTASSSRSASATSPPTSPCPRSGSTAPISASCSSTSPTAATSTPLSSRSPAIRVSRRCRPASSCASRPSCAGRLNEVAHPVHPLDPTIRGVTHILWTGRPRPARARPQRRLLRRERDRPQPLRHRHLGPHGPARRSRAACRRRVFVHESIIGSEFEGRIEATTSLGGQPAIVPSIAGWARTTGHNTIFVDDRDPYWRGFQVA